MSLLQQESFVVVAEEGHVGRAARRLYVSQPPLSRRIASLETSVGQQLFQRTPRGMRLLPAGERLLLHARDILRQVAKVRDEDEMQGLSSDWDERPSSALSPALG